MKVSGVSPVTRSRGVGRTAGASNVAPAGTMQPARSVVDVARFLGITEEELTPNVRTGLERLLEEVDRLRKDTEQLVKRVEYLERLADEDFLTPILNRRAFVRELSRVIAYAERYRSTSSVLYFDINGMKAINDTHGHAAGDAALNHVAGVLLANVRGSDVVGRLGGDEFAAILHQSDLDAARRKGEELVEAIRARPLVYAGKTITLDSAVGAFAFNGERSADEILDHADQQMYADKRRTREAKSEG